MLYARRLDTLIVDVAHLVICLVGVLESNANCEGSCRCFLCVSTRNCAKILASHLYTRFNTTIVTYIIQRVFSSIGTGSGSGSAVTDVELTETVRGVDATAVGSVHCDHVTAAQQC
jgi:hypothetical protein